MKTIHGYDCVLKIIKLSILCDIVINLTLTLAKKLVFVFCKIVLILIIMLKSIKIIY